MASASTNYLRVLLSFYGPDAATAAPALYRELFGDADIVFAPRAGQSSWTYLRAVKDNICTLIMLGVETLDDFRQLMDSASAPQIIVGGIGVNRYCWSAAQPAATAALITASIRYGGYKLVGHSAGGGAARIMGSYLRASGYDGQVDTITFGSPRIMTRLGESFASMGDLNWSGVDDPIVYIPPSPEVLDRMAASGVLLSYFANLLTPLTDAELSVWGDCRRTWIDRHGLSEARADGGAGVLVNILQLSGPSSWDALLAAISPHYVATYRDRVPTLGVTMFPTSDFGLALISACNANIATPPAGTTTPMWAAIKAAALASVTNGNFITAMGGLIPGTVSVAAGRIVNGLAMNYSLGDLNPAFGGGTGWADDVNTQYLPGADPFTNLLALTYTCLNVDKTLDPDEFEDYLIELDLEQVSGVPPTLTGPPQVYAFRPYAGIQGNPTFPISNKPGQNRSTTVPKEYKAVSRRAGLKGHGVWLNQAWIAMFDNRKSSRKFARLINEFFTELGCATSFGIQNMIDQIQAVIVNGSGMNGYANNFVLPFNGEA